MRGSVIARDPCHCVPQISQGLAREPRRRPGSGGDVSMPRAIGANSKLHMAVETAYGTPPDG
jgi:hypothetical protein